MWWNTVIGLETSSCAPMTRRVTDADSEILPSTEAGATAARTARPLDEELLVALPRSDPRC